jgi:transposase
VGIAPNPTAANNARSNGSSSSAAAVLNATTTLNIGAVPNIPNRSNRTTKYRWTKALYRERNRVERFFNELKQYRRIATRYDKLGANFFAFVKLASMRIWLRSIESTA